jgi:hypothetical protein
MSMTAKHTPGPLIVCINSIDGRISIQQDREHCEYEPTVTVDCVDDMGEGLDRETGLANAYLYAAAPDLLAACKALIDAPHYEHLAARLHSEEMKAVEAIKAAIAKAEAP